GITLGANGGGFDQTVTWTWSGPIAGTSGGSLTQSGTGTTILSSTASSYNGATAITAGSIQNGASEVIPNTSALSVSSGATWNLNNFNETVGSIAGAGSVTLGTGNVTAGGDNTSTTFSGTFTGSGLVTKNGSGAWTLSGNSASFTGGVTLNAG